jgi:hypothetical protein
VLEEDDWNEDNLIQTHINEGQELKKQGGETGQEGTVPKEKD